MKMTINKIGILSACLSGFLLIGFGTQNAVAQDIGSGGGSVGNSGSRAGTSGAAELLVPLTARYTSLGGASTSGVAGMSGIEALYANPAGLALGSGTSAMFSRMNYVADIGVNYFGLSQQVGENNHIALTISTWDFGDIPKQSEISPEISDVTFNVSYLTAGFSYGRTLTDRISVGTTFKVVSETIDDLGASAVAIDAGMNYVVGESGLRFGVALKNIGSDIKYSGTGMVQLVRLPGQDPTANSNAVSIEGASEVLPTLLNFGAAYSRPVGAGSVVTVLGNFRSNSFDPNQYSGGLEFNYQDMFFLRGGYLMNDESDSSFFQGASFGAGFNINMGGSMLTLDYAFQPTDYFDNVQYITAVITM